MCSATKWEELAQVSPLRETVLTIGVFDGVHLGHQHLIERLKRGAKERGFVPGVVTFRCHPLRVLRPEAELPSLMTLDERIRLLRGLGVELVVPLSFTHELAETSAREFVVALREYLNMRAMVVGPDFALGRGREGDGPALSSLGEEMGFTVDVAMPVVLEGEVVSSTATRQYLAQGDIGKVRRFLGHSFGLHGKVVHGDERGRTLGFPTANLAVNSNQALPADGVYVTRAFIEGRPYPSVTNIGSRPTFGGQERTIEVYLLDFCGELYDKELWVELIDHLREERRFSSAGDLSAQIVKDVDQARGILRGEA